jgi:uncharacterized protein
MPNDNSGGPPRVILNNGRRPHLAAGQCDACPSSAPLVSPERTLPPSGGYSIPPTLSTTRLGDHHWLAYAPAASGGPAVLNESALALLHHFERPRSSSTLLTDQKITWETEAVTNAISRMQEARLLVPVCPAHPLADSPRTLIAWLHVTQACNLRCSYCYLDAAPEGMSPEVGDRALEAVFHSAVKHHLSEIRLKYAGGEPTLAFPLIVRLHCQAIRLAKERALELDGVVISNGVHVTQEMLETMQTLGLRLVISLDGLGAYHDCQRRFANGTGSFAAVSQTIDRALSLGLVPDISVTVTGRSLPGLPELMQWLLERDLPFGLELYRGNGVSAFQEDLRLDQTLAVETMRTVFRVIESNLPRRSLLASLVDRTNLAWPHTRACSAGTNYLVIDTQGHVAKCQMDIGCTVTDIYADDPLADIRADQTGIHNLPVDEKKECQECEWRYWCAGGCPLEAYRATGRWDTRSPQCSIYRALFPEVLRLEGLRLLRYDDAPS